MEVVEIPFHGNMDTMSLDKIAIHFLLGCHQHWAQREDDIKEVLNISNEKETHLKIRQYLRPSPL